MRKLITILSLIPAFALAQNTDTLLYERFNSGGSSFDLSTTDMNSVDAATGYNQWVVNNAYTGGTGTVICLGIPNSFTIPNTPNQPAATTGGTNTGYMHITSDAGTSSGITNCSYLAASGICGNAENYFARMNSDVSTIAYDSVNVSFVWLCAGANNDYGEFYYSTDGGVSWNLVNAPVAQFHNQSNWTTYTTTLPAFTNQPTLRFGFRFVNQVAFSASDPAFGVDDFLITALEVAGPPVAQFAVSDTVVCEGACVDYSDMSLGAAPTSWLWIFQGSSTPFSTSENPTGICYPTAGVYTTTLIVNTPAGTDTLTAPAVTVNAAPQQPALTVSGDTLIAPAGYTTYMWYVDGVLIPGADTDTLFVTAGGNYAVVVANANGCTAASTQVLMTTGIAENGHLSGMLYPNPASATIYMQGIVGSNIRIIDFTGRVVCMFTASDDRVPVSQLAPGSYLLVLTKDGNASVYRFTRAE